MKYLPILLATSLVASCSGTPRYEVTWLTIDGKEAAPELVNAASTDCDFDKKARMVKRLRDLAYEEDRRSYGTGDYIDGRHKKLFLDKENAYYKNANKIAVELNECMYENGVVSVAVPQDPNAE